MKHFEAATFLLLAVCGVTVMSAEAQAASQGNVIQMENQHAGTTSWLLTQDILNARGMVEFRHLTAVSRALTALFDVATVWLVFLLGRRVYDEKVGLLAAAFLALNVMHIQLAHFFSCA